MRRAGTGGGACLTADRVAETVARLRAGERPAPYAPALPMTVSIRMASAEDADRAARRPPSAGWTR